MPSKNQYGYDHDVARRWLENTAKWDGELHAIAQKRLKPISEAVGDLEADGGASQNYRFGLETIVRRSRPVLPIRDDRISLDGANIDDEESRHVVDLLRGQAARVEPVIPLVGRIDVVNEPMGRPFLGTGWLVAPDLVVTNRHVAGIIGERSGTKFVFRSGRFGDPIGARLDFKHEIDGTAATPIRVTEVIWIEPLGDGPDIAFLRLEKPRDGASQNRIEIADADAAPGTRAAVIGYPARAPAEVIPDQQWMDRIYRNTYDVKRIAPGLITNPARGSATHDCTTLGGNSGSVVIDTATGKALGLHFAGVYLLENYAVPASTIRAFLKRPPWLESRGSNQPAPDKAPPRKPEQATSSSQPPVPLTTQTAAPQPGAVTVTSPLIVTVALGQPTTGPAPQVTATTTLVDASTLTSDAVRSFSDAYRGNGLLGASAGRAIVDGRVTDRTCIRAVAHPDRFAEVKRRLPAIYEGYPVEVRAASLLELSEASGAGIAEAVVTSIRYNDDDRAGPDFSFEPLETDNVLCHVGPERSWVVLKDFLGKAAHELVCSMYEFHASYIADQIADRLKHETKVDLVLATQSRDRRSGPAEEPDSNTFGRQETFADWHREFGDNFENIFVPIGSSGLVANAYHIKVTVRDRRFVWLSSGNWKSSSQPLIEAADLQDPKKTVAAGNREWHVVIDNQELAKRFRSHILADLEQSKRLGGHEEAPEGTDALVDIPDTMLEAAIEEAPRAPARVLDPLRVSGRINVKPLLTPDQKGAVYCEAVLDLIRSARRQLLFQIPYITVKPNEDPDSFINQLVDALVERAKTIEDVRVILRTDNSQWKPGSITLSDRGMDVARQLRHVGSTHTKGMIVDGRHALVGSHNWSSAGVTLNRDASLIFDDPEIADYFKQAFEMDWARARQVSIQEAVMPEATPGRLAAPGSAVPTGYRRMRLADYLDGAGMTTRAGARRSPLPTRSAGTESPPAQPPAPASAASLPGLQPIAQIVSDTMLSPLPPAVALTGQADASSFSLQQLGTEAFSWQTALSLAMASKLAYESSGAVEDFTIRQWGFNNYETLDMGGTQGFIARSSDVMLIAFRGTDQLTDWLDDLDVRPESRPYGIVHAGFLAAFRRVEAQLKSALAGAGVRRIWLTGHSLGGALATITAAELRPQSFTGIYTYGQPRVVDAAARGMLDNTYAGRFVRFVNNRDLVTRVPPGFLHVGRLIHFNASGGLDETGLESVETVTEPPVFTLEQFDKMKAQIRKLKQSASQSRGEVQEAIAGINAEGLFPGLGDHRLDLYIAAIRRFTSHAVSDPRIAVEVSARMAAERFEMAELQLGGAEAAAVATPSRRSSGMIPLLIKVRNKKWTPPEGVEIGSQLGYVWTAHARYEAVQGLETDPGVVSLELSREGGLYELAASVSYVKGDQVHRPPIDERGDAALVGLVDSGIDILHHAFRKNDDQSYRTRIVAIWNQQDSTGPSPNALDPVNFNQKYGTLYLNRDIQALIDAGGPVPTALRDPELHGTHVASIAAGRKCAGPAGAAGPYMSDGVAPDAGIVMVIPKLKANAGDPWSVGYSVNHADAVSFLQTVARGRNKVLTSALPMAVNLSFGMNAGGHDGSSLLEAGIDSCTDKGRLPGFVVVKSAGNERGFGGHQRIQAFPGIMTITWLSSATSRPRDYFEVWYSYLDDLSFWLKDPAGNSTPVVSKASRKQEVTIGGNVCLLELTLSQGDMGDCRLTITISTGASPIQAGGWTLHVQGNKVQSPGKAVDIWVERNDMARGAIRFLPETPEMTLSIPGTADTVICVAACGSKDPLSLIPESSFGPTRIGGPKPDLSAPGESIVAALANTDDHQAVVAMKGTSMAAPHVTGALALALSVRHKEGNRPQHNAVQLRSALNTTASVGWPHPGFGHGVLNVQAMLDYLKTIP